MSPCDHSNYLEQGDVCDIKESTFFKKVNVNRNFSETFLPFWWPTWSEYLDIIPSFHFPTKNKSSV